MSPILRTALLRYGCIVFLLALAVAAMLVASGCAARPSTPDHRVEVRTPANLYFEMLDINNGFVVERDITKEARADIANDVMRMRDITRADAMLVVDRVDQRMSILISSVRHEFQTLAPLCYKVRGAKTNTVLSAYEYAMVTRGIATLKRRLRDVRALNNELLELVWHPDREILLEMRRRMLDD